MGSPISIGDAITLVEKAVTLYRAVKGWPKEIEKIGDKMEGLSLYLLDIQRLLATKALAQLQSQQRFQKVARDITEDAKDVHYILKIYHETGSMLQKLFPFGRHPRELENLTNSIDENRRELDSILQVQQSFANLPVIVPSGSASGLNRTDYGLTFIDPNNLGRSKVAEGYIKLLGEWTRRTGGSWPVKFAHSAGMGIRSRSDCIDTLESLNMNLHFNYGNKAPNEIAIASLLDNKRFDPSKPALLNYLSESRSRGITQSLFKTYDYILVFVGREYTNLLRLKKQLLQEKGQDIAPKGKGRVVHLGGYLSKSDKPIEILDAPKNKDGTDSRANWNVTTGQIKLAIRTFLTKELRWNEPPKST